MLDTTSEVWAEYLVKRCSAGLPIAGTSWLFSPCPGCQHVGLHVGAYGGSYGSVIMHTYPHTYMSVSVSWRGRMYSTAVLWDSQLLRVRFLALPTTDRCPTEHPKGGQRVPGLLCRPICHPAKHPSTASIPSTCHRPCLCVCGQGRWVSILPSRHPPYRSRPHLVAWC